MTCSATFPRWPTDPKRRATLMASSLGGFVKHRHLVARTSALAAVLVVLAAGCSSDPNEGARPAPTSTSPAPEQSTASAKPTVEKVDVVAVGDIACDPTSPVFDDPQYCRHEEVARLTHKLVRQGAQYFMPLGDIQYEKGSLEAFRQVYDKYFGDLKPITEPVPGNHEYYTEGASGYFRYFGKRAGTPQKPWSSFSPMDGWRVYLLDSNCDYIGGCGPDSPEGKWLAKELKKSPETCSIAAWHHPLHTSGEYNGDQPTMDLARPLWDAVDAGGVDIVLNGHDHIYDRFAPIGGVTSSSSAQAAKRCTQSRNVHPTAECSSTTAPASYGSHCAPTTASTTRSSTHPTTRSWTPERSAASTIRRTDGVSYGVRMTAARLMRRMGE